MDTYIVFWLAATVVFVLVELMTVGLTSIWFAVIRKGELIEIVKISGVKLIVKRVKEA